MRPRYQDPCRTRRKPEPRAPRREELSHSVQTVRNRLCPERRLRTRPLSFPTPPLAFPGTGRHPARQTAEAFHARLHHRKHRTVRGGFEEQSAGNVRCPTLTVPFAGSASRSTLALHGTSLSAGWTSSARSTSFRPANAPDRQRPAAKGPRHDQCDSVRTQVRWQVTGSRVPAASENRGLQRCAGAYMAVQGLLNPSEGHHDKPCASRLCELRRSGPQPGGTAGGGGDCHGDQGNPKEEVMCKTGEDLVQSLNEHWPVPRMKAAPSFLRP